MSIQGEYKNIDSIKDLLRVREGARTEWELDFLANYMSVAQKISESIFKNFISQFKTSISSPYKPLPSPSTRFKIVYPLSVEKNSHDMRSWSQEAKELPPFAEWYLKFDPSSEMSGQDRVIHERGNLEGKYFQPLVDKMVGEVKRNLTLDFERFRSEPENSPFHLEILSLEEKIEISAWIEEEVFHKKKGVCSRMSCALL